MSWDSYLNNELRKYQHKDLCKRQIIPAIAAYKDLRPSMQIYVQNDGRRTDLFTLEGTIPVNFKGSLYNIPVCLFLQERHPFVPPIVYVRPTNTMGIKASKYVDNTGRVFMPSLAEWNHPNSDLATLIQMLCCIFAEGPPVFAKPAGYVPPVQPGFQPQYGGGYPPTSSSTPPYPAGPHRMPTPMSIPMRPGESANNKQTDILYYDVSNVENLMTQLKDRYGERYLSNQYRKWADMIHSGTASANTPPSEITMDATKKLQQETLVKNTVTDEAVGNAMSSMQLSASENTDDSSPPTAASTHRSALIQQLKDLFELKEIGAISASEYEEQKKTIMKDMLS